MKQSVSSKVRVLVAPKIEEMGYTLWDVTYGKEGGEMLLTVIVDKKGGISLKDITAVSDAINPIIDEADPISVPYSLMVESAGLERTLRTDEHLKFAVDASSNVTVKLYKALEGSKAYNGIIRSFDDDCIQVETDDKTIEIERKIL